MPAAGRFGPGNLPASAGPGWRALLLLAALGAAQSLALVHTAWWPLTLLALAVLAHQVARASPGRAALAGWAFGLGWLLASVWWLFISMHRYGQLPAPLAAAAVLLLCGAMALIPALAMAWVARQRGGRVLPDALRFAAAWLATELARGHWFTGFPWGASGYTQVDGPLAALAPWVGVYGMGAVLALAAALLAAAWRWPGPPAGIRGPAAAGVAGGKAQASGRPWRPAAAEPVANGRSPLAWAPLLGALLLLAGPALLGTRDFTEGAGTITVTLLQPNVPQDEKFATERLPDTLAWLGRSLVTSNAQLVVAPETAVPLLPDQLSTMVPGFWQGLQRHFGRPDGPAALIGVPLGNEASGYTNSAAGLSASVPYRYDKAHLVPFGEFIPTGFRWFTEMMNIPLGDFNRGPRTPQPFVVQGQRVAPNICYEDLFGEELAARFAQSGSAPTVLANISNIGWFGDTVAVGQHLGISRLRSLELQRPMLRATNTGATVVIDHQGRVTARLAPFTQGVLDAPVEGRRGLTPFARWAAVAGLWPLWALAVLGLAWPRRAGAGR